MLAARRLLVAAMLAVPGSQIAALDAQAPVALKARLSTVPIDVAMQATVAGSGSAVGTLAGGTLTVEGSYRGLVTPATTVRVYESPRQGMRGTFVGEFASGGATTGTFKGTVTLSTAQAAAFGKGLIYVQLQSEKAPEGNLWGWFTPAKGRRP